MLHKAATNASNTLEGFRRNVEIAFDDAMERASGWYKRKVQIVIAVIAAVLALGLNVDTLQVGTGLWKDPALRAAVVAKAGAAQQSDVSTTPADADEASPAATAAKQIDAIEELNLPVGWGSDNSPDNLGEVIQRIPGWAITVAALLLGAPFWFDLLSRFSRLRGVGDPPGAPQPQRRQVSQVKFLRISALWRVHPEAGWCFAVPRERRVEDGLVGLPRQRRGSRRCSSPSSASRSTGFEAARLWRARHEHREHARIHLDRRLG